MTAKAIYLCAACGKVASTVRLVEPGQPDPRLTPEPPGAPPGISMLGALSDWPRLSIDGGPVSVTIGPGPMEGVAVALQTGQASKLVALNWEYAPFWCPKCGASYCADHYSKQVLFDDGFFDCIRGVCPEGHERILED